MLLVVCRVSVVVWWLLVGGCCYVVGSLMFELSVARFRVWLFDWSVGGGCLNGWLVGWLLIHPFCCGCFNLLVDAFFVLILRFFDYICFFFDGGLVGWFACLVAWYAIDESLVCCLINV